MPHGTRSLQIDFDLIDHSLRIATSSGGERSVKLRPRTVASFYEEVMRRLDELGVPVAIHTTPNEMPDAIPFERDEEHSTYDPDPAGRFRKALLQAARVLTEFRAGFRGKCSPVHFFWGGFDLAVAPVRRSRSRGAAPGPGPPGARGARATAREGSRDLRTGPRVRGAHPTTRGGGRAARPRPGPAGAGSRAGSLLAVRVLSGHRAEGCARTPLTPVLRPWNEGGPSHVWWNEGCDE